MKAITDSPTCFYLAKGYEVMDDVRAKAFAIGINDFIVKTIQTEELHAVIERFTNAN
jgi:hypothetical protein